MTSCFDSRNTISFANLNDTGGGGKLITTGVTPHEPNGLAVDPETGKIYWANKDTISFANLNDTGGGGTLNTTGATTNGAGLPVLLNAPSGTGAPVISGDTTVGSALSCSQGVWAPELLPAFDYLAPQGFAYSWSENGTPIAGASTSSITASTPGSYSCTVTASNQAGSTPQSSAAVTITASAPSTLVIPLTPILTGLSETAKTWREGTALAAISKKKKTLPLGTTFSFTLNESATVTFTFTERVSGRKVGTKCVAQTNKNEHKHRCTRTVTAGTLAFSADAGTNKVRFEGLISKHRKLKPGSYTVLVSATASGKLSASSALRFTIASGPLRQH